MIGPKTAASWHEGEITGGFIATPEGGLELALLDRWPDWRGRELSADGTWAGWSVPLPDEITHYKVGETRPGKRTAAGATKEEKEPPRLDTMTIQTAAPVPLGEAWPANQPRIDGFSPYHSKTDPHAADLDPLGEPEVEVIAAEGGYAGGLTAVLYTLENDFGETTASGAAFVNLATGEGYRLYLPEGLQGGARGPLSAKYFNVYQGKPFGGVSSALKQRRFLLDEIQDPYVEMLGSYKDTGRKPPTRNESGIGRPPQVALGGGNPDRARLEKRKVRGRFAAQPGKYRGGIQLVKGAGRSLVSQWSREVTVTEEEAREGIALVFIPPRSLKAGERYVPWITKDDVPMRGYAKRGGLSEGEAYDHNEKVEIYGYAPDAEPKGLKDGFTELSPPDPNDPSSDTTAIEPPDPNQPPDEPVPIGVSVERGQPCVSLVAVSGVTEDGREAARSKAARVSLGALQTYRVRPQPPVGQLANARFSDRTPDGKPALWNLRNLPAGRFEASAGGLTMLQPVTIGSDFPAAESQRPMAITPDMTVTFVGSVAVLRRIGGIARLVAEELDEAGAVVRSTFLKSITSGKSSLGRRGFRMGANTLVPWHESAVAVRYVGRMGLGTDASVNMDMRVEGLEMLPFAAAPRPFSRLEDGSVTFEPGAAVPHPDRSHFAVGECPIPAGAETEVTDPALSRVSFDSGAFDPTPTDSVVRWTSEAANGATAAVNAAAAMHGPFGVEVKSDNTGARSHNRRRFDAGAGKTSLAIRQPVRASRPTNRGEVMLHTITDGQDRPMAQVRHTVGLSYVVEALGPQGGTLARRTILADDGSAYDVELIADVSRGAKDGRVSVGASYFGGAREILAEMEGLDFTGRAPRHAYGQVFFETNSQSRWTYHFDEIVVTPGGDLANREAPALPAGEVPEDPDAPPDGAGGFRLSHPDGARVRQSAFFLRPGTRPQTVGPRTEEPIPVKPGQDFTVAVFGSHSKFGENRDAPSYPFGVILKGPGKEPLWLGSPYGEACVGESGWREWWRVYSVPEKAGPDDPGYTEASIESREMADVYALWQEGLFADGALTAAADRELARTLARRTNGSVRVTVDSRPKSVVHTPRAYRTHRWASFGVRGTGIANARYRSGPSKAGPWSPETPDPDLVPEDSCLQVAFDAAPGEDGISEVPPGGVWLSLAQDIAVLQTEDGEDLPGLAVIGELLPDYTRGNYAVKEIGGKPFGFKTSPDVRRLPAFAVGVYTEDAARMLMESNPNKRWRIPDPHADNGAGLDFLVRLSDVLEAEDKEPPTEIRDGVRRVLATFAVPYALVEAAAPLERAR